MTAGPSAAIIRPVVASDFAQWLPLWDGYKLSGQIDAAERMERKRQMRLASSKGIADGRH